MSLAINTKSTLGEMGFDLSRLGQIVSFQSPDMNVESASTPPSEEKQASEKPEDLVEPQPQELTSNVEMEIPTPPIKVSELAEIETMQLDMQVDAVPLVNLSEMAVPEVIEEVAKPEQPKPKPKQVKKESSNTAIASNAAKASEVKKSSLGSSSSKAAGKISVSYKYAPQPPYPSRLRAAKTTGTVVVRIQVDSHGKPLSVSIKNSSGYDEFDDIARSWILNKWIFNPAQENGHAVASIVTTSIHFVYG